MRNFKQLLTIFLALTAGIFLQSCNDDEEVLQPFALESLTTDNDIDLNAATSPSNVPANASIVATYTRDVDAATANNSRITLVRDYDEEEMDLDISVSGNVITITPAEPLGEGTMYELNISDEVAATDGSTTSAISRTFSTSGTFAPAGQVAYFPMDGSAEDAVNGFTPASEDVVDIEWGENRHGEEGAAATFNGNTSIIEIPNGPELLGEQVTISFWMYLNTDNHLDANGNPAGHFIMGLGNFRGFQFETNGGVDFLKMAGQYRLSGEFAGETAGSDFFFNGSGNDRNSDGFYATTFAKDLSGSGGVADLLEKRWAHMVVTYNGDENVRTMYIDGEVMQIDDLASLEETGDPGLLPLSTAEALTFLPGDAWGDKLALGFIHDRSSTEWANEPWGSYNEPTSNHFKGRLDDLRIFNVALTEEEVRLMHNSERP
jgi:hypothetical protein